MSSVAFDAHTLESKISAHSSSLDIEIPPVLRASVERHQANLARLLQSLRAAGMDEAEIEAAVTVVVDSYKHELLQAIRTLKASDQTAEGSL